MQEKTTETNKTTKNKQNKLNVNENENVNDNENDNVNVNNNDNVCVLNINIFSKYWKLLLLNYNQKHTQEKHKLYYSFFKDVEEKDFILAIKECIKHQQYFPNVAEIYKYLPNKDVPKWFNETIEHEPTTKEEQEELEKLFKDFRKD